MHHWGDAYFPAFNIAEFGISIGRRLLAVDAFFESGKEGRRRGDK